MADDSEEQKMMFCYKFSYQIDYCALTIPDYVDLYILEDEKVKVNVDILIGLIAKEELEEEMLKVKKVFWRDQKNNINCQIKQFGSNEIIDLPSSLTKAEIILDVSNTKQNDSYFNFVKKYYEDYKTIKKNNLQDDCKEEEKLVLTISFCSKIADNYFKQYINELPKNNEELTKAFKEYFKDKLKDLDSIEIDNNDIIPELSDVKDDVNERDFQTILQNHLQISFGKKIKVFTKEILNTLKVEYNLDYYSKGFKNFTELEILEMKSNLFKFINFLKYYHSKKKIIPSLLDQDLIKEVLQQKFIENPFNKNRIKYIEDLLNEIKVRNHKKGKLFGVLIHGPSGTGKTVLAKETFSFVGARKLFFNDTTALLDKFVGEPEKKIQNYLSQAKLSPYLLNYIIMDEIHYLAKKSFNGNSSDYKENILSKLLTVLNDIHNLYPNVVIVFCTNHYHLLPPEFTRNGRIDKKIFIPCLSFEEKKSIFKQHFGEKACFKHDEDLLNNIIKCCNNFTIAKMMDLMKNLEKYFYDYQVKHVKKHPITSICNYLSENQEHPYSRFVCKWIENNNYKQQYCIKQSEILPLVIKISVESNDYDIIPTYKVIYSIQMALPKIRFVQWVDQHFITKALDYVNKDQLNNSFEDLSKEIEELCKDNDKEYVMLVFDITGLAGLIPKSINVGHQEGIGNTYQQTFTTGEQQSKSLSKSSTQGFSTATGFSLGSTDSDTFGSTRGTSTGTSYTEGTSSSVSAGASFSFGPKIFDVSVNVSHGWNSSTTKTSETSFSESYSKSIAKSITDSYTKTFNESETFGNQFTYGTNQSFANSSSLSRTDTKSMNVSFEITNVEIFQKIKYGLSHYLMPLREKYNNICIVLLHNTSNSLSVECIETLL
ncbi:hypothetical protein ABK040_003953 [Willaertia magna]